MNQIQHDPIDDVLRSLDAAPADLTPEQQSRADALLDSLLTPETSTNVVPLRPRRRVARWLVPVAAASALTVGALAWPWNPSTQRAYADWTAEPTAVTPATLTKVTEGCRQLMGQWGADASTARVALAEQRGTHVFVALTADDGSTGECLVDAADGVVRGGTGSGPAPAGTELPPLGPREAEVNGPGGQGGPEGAFGFTRGRVGSEVVGVMIKAGDKTIEATVGNGEYVAWWPSTMEAISGPGVTDVDVDLTFADGTTKTDHQSRPGMERPGATDLGRVAEGRGVEGGRQVGFAEGLVGVRVTGVTVHADGIDTVAQVRDGLFTAKWDLPAGVRADGSAPEVGYTVTLDDGTVLEDVKPLNR